MFFLFTLTEILTIIICCTLCVESFAHIFPRQPRINFHHYEMSEREFQISAKISRSFFSLTSIDLCSSENTTCRLFKMVKLHI